MSVNLFSIQLCRPRNRVGAAVLTFVISLQLIGCSGTQEESGFVDTSGGIARLGAVPQVGAVDPSVTLQPRYASGTPSTTEYKIGVSDVLKVTVFQVEDLNRKVQVSGNGTITMPLIGQVRAVGHTTQEVETEIATRLRARFLQSPQVTVLIEEFNAHKITIGGSVKKPGVYPIKGALTLLQAIAMAEGLDTVADPSNVVVFREQSGSRYVAKFDITQIRSGGAGDPLMENGDVVMIDNSGMKTVLRDWSPALGTLGAAATFVSVIK